MAGDGDLLARVDERTKLMMVTLGEIKEGLNGKAGQADLLALDKRVQAAEQKVWYAAGASATVAFFAGIIGKSMIGGSKP